MSTSAFLLHLPLFQTKSVCAHHWLVAPLPTDGAYPARCRRCGAQRAFPHLDPSPAADDTALTPFQALDPTPILTPIAGCDDPIDN